MGGGEEVGMFVSILTFEIVKADVKVKGLLFHLSPFSHLNTREFSAPNPKNMVFYMGCWVIVSA